MSRAVLSGRGENVAPPEIDVDELHERLERGAVLLDVRRREEHQEANIPDALLITLDELPDRLDEIPDTEVVHVICRSGARSAAACEFLASKGVTAVNVAGGMLAWIESGRPVNGTTRTPPPG